MRTERVATLNSGIRDESQTLTSLGHQALTADDHDVLDMDDSTTLQFAVETEPAPRRSLRRFDPPGPLAHLDWRPPRRSAAHRVAKRVIDVVVSLAALVSLFPLFLLIAVAIKLGDFGSILYTQTRVGRGGRHFRFYKFRTMVPNAEALKSDLVGLNHFQGDITFKITHDPRVTRIGKLLRKTSLDELPQLWHVLMGDMTLVGPRPAVPSEVEEYSPYELRRVAVLPGLTCYWQVSGRSDLPFEAQVELDLKYIENESLWLDFVLLARTVPALLLMKGAY